MDLIIGGEDVQASKPSPEGVQFALRALQAVPEQTLYVGDSTIDARTAQAAGLPFLGVLHGTTTRSELAAYPHVAIADSLEALL